MTLKEAVEMVKEKAGGRVPVSGHETEHFFVFTCLSYDFDEHVAGSPTFVIDKETGETGFMSNQLLAMCDPTMDDESEWDQFKHYDSDEIVKEYPQMEAELRALLKK